MSGAQRATHQLPPATEESRDRPLCVDLDGTLLLSDILWESLAYLLRTRPLQLLACPGWLLKGRAAFKRRLAEAAPLPVDSLPYDPALLAWLSAEKARGRKLVLVSATDQRVVDRVAAHLQLFDVALGSDGTTNLKAEAKAQALQSRFGHAFAYLGDSPSDLAVLGQCAEPIVVGSSRAVLAAAGRGGRSVGVFPRTRDRWALARCLRPLHWSKNLLMLIPLLTSHRLAELPLWGNLAQAFLAFSLIASGVYVLNDLLDLASDRAHPRKRNRPFASGRLSLAWGFGLVVPLFAAGIALAAFLPAGAIVVLGAYIVLTSLYSFRLKQILLVDVFGLAILYTVRIVEGHEAAGIAYSPWLLAFSLFMFISLALVKRASELFKLQSQGVRRTPGRGYQIDDSSVIAAAGVASGLCACIVCILYLSSTVVQHLYQQPELLWLLSPALVYWVIRLWLLAGRGLVDDDPILFALRDRVTYAIAAWALLVLAFASHSWLPRLNFVR